MTSKTIGQIYSQINPDVVGSERRNLEIAKKYGTRLASVTENAKSHTVNHLVGCYPSHDFIIDDGEAKKWFHRVDLPSAELYELVAAIGQPAYGELDEIIVVPLSGLAMGERDAKPDPDIEASDAGGTPPVDEGGSSDRQSDPGEAEFGHGTRQPRSVAMRPRAVQND